MILKPLASDSMGARSMAFSVSTRKAGLVIDPGVALGPWRFGLEPHEIELVRLRQLKNNILAEINEVDAVSISHYHYDHYFKDRPDAYAGKVLLIKHPKRNINKSQQGRSAKLLKSLDAVLSADSGKSGSDASENTGGGSGSVDFADGRFFEIGDLAIQFSEALPHGTNTKLGWVVGVAVSAGDDVFVHTSDIEGPSLDEQLAFILESQPTVLACDGPMTYLMYRYGNKAMEASLLNLERIISETPVRTMMLDHHFLRDDEWAGKIGPVFAAAEASGCDITTFAGFAGEKNDLLEARRRELWGQ